MIKNEQNGCYEKRTHTPKHTQHYMTYIITPSEISRNPSFHVITTCQTGTRPYSYHHILQETKHIPNQIAKNIVVKRMNWIWTTVHLQTFRGKLCWKINPKTVTMRAINIKSYASTNCRIMAQILNWFPIFITVVLYETTIKQLLLVSRRQGNENDWPQFIHDRSRFSFDYVDNAGNK